MTTRVQDPAINLHQMRVEFFSFERGVIEAHLENVLESIKRSHPNFNVPTFRMLSFHNLLEFQTTQPSARHLGSSTSKSVWFSKVSLAQNISPKLQNISRGAHNYCPPISPPKSWIPF
jgi:hypothetical protein